LERSPNSLPTAQGYLIALRFPSKRSAWDPPLQGASSARHIRAQDAPLAAWPAGRSWGRYPLSAPVPPPGHPLSTRWPPAGKTPLRS